MLISLSSSPMPIQCLLVIQSNNNFDPMMVKLFSTMPCNFDPMMVKLFSTMPCNVSQSDASQLVNSFCWDSMQCNAKSVYLILPKDSVQCLAVPVNSIGLSTMRCCYCCQKDSMQCVVVTAERTQCQCNNVMPVSLISCCSPMQCGQSMPINLISCSSMQCGQSMPISLDLFRAISWSLQSNL